MSAPAAEAAAAPQPAIHVEGLTKRFGARLAVADLSLDVGYGQIFGVIGPNGSGKTTTIRMLCGLLTPDSGRGSCLGLDIIADAKALKRRVGYMTQRFSLYEELTVRENLIFVGRIHGIAKLRDQVDAIVERLKLGPYVRQLAGRLSGGWKQRLALAACILPRPGLLLLDEPTAGVDPQARQDFWTVIHDLAGEGMTVLVSTHYMDEAERCEEIAYVAGGRILARGSARSIIGATGIGLWVAEGRGLADLRASVIGQPGIDLVAPFGASLHIIGRDPEALEQTLAPFRSRPGLVLAKSTPTLEDVFLELQRRSS